MPPTPILLTAELILKLYDNYEPSRVKMWEMVRSFDPVDFSKLLYVLENVVKSRRREVLALTTTTENDVAATVAHDDRTIIMDYEPAIRLTPCTYYANHYDNKKITDLYTNIWAKHGETSADTTGGNVCGITKIMDDIRSGKRVVCNTDASAAEMIVHHNLSTSIYGKLLLDIKSLLLNENYQVDRNNFKLSNKMSNNGNGTAFSGRGKETSIVLQFLQFYKSMSYNNATCVDNDPRGFRFLLVPPPIPITNAEQYYNMTRSGSQSADFIYQPYYMGFRVNVYTSPTETKIFNTYGELIISLSNLCLRSRNYCTFEAIILPVDKNNVVRSYRYWAYRSNFIIYIVDVYRVNQRMLVTLPFSERITFAPGVVASSFLRANHGSATQPRLECIPSHLQNVKQLESRQLKNCDVFDPIVGVVIRNKMHCLTFAENEATMVRAYKFNIRHGFDLIEMKPVDFSQLLAHDNVRTLRNYRYYFNLDMADYKVVCLVYGHCARFFYICEYDRQLQQFVHVAKLERHITDRGGGKHGNSVKFSNNKNNKRGIGDNGSDITLPYKPERLYVVNNKTLPRGLIYLRVYYNMHKHVIGYEIKLTDCRFKLPYTNHLLKK